MTQIDNTPVQEPDAPQTEEAGAVATFAFPFKPGQFNAARNNQPWYQKGNGCNHDCRPGPAPRGSRRSMGKR